MNKKPSYEELELELKETKKLLHESDQRFQSFMDNAPVGVAIFDDRFRYVYINKILQEINGPSVKDHLGKKIDEVIPETAKAVKPYLEKILLTGKPITNTELTGKLPSSKGKTRHLLVSYFPVTMMSDKTSLIGAVVLDISERYAAEQTLAKNERKMNSIFRAAPIGIGVTANRIFLEVNERFCQITGYSEQELLGQEARMLYDTDEDYENVGYHYRKLEKGGFGSVEARLKRKDGKMIDVLVNYARFGEENDAVQMSFSALDITKKKELEENIRQSTKLEAIGTLAGGIAHDFNNILFPIIGFSEMLKKDLQADPELSKKIEQILIASKRAKEMIKQILAFSRKTKAHTKSVQPCLIVGEAGKLMRASIPSTIEIQMNCDSKTHQILADPTGFHQMVVNLMTNAYQAMEETGGTMNVELKNVEYYGNKYVRLSVSDTGMGIPPDIQSKIFDPYFTTKKEKKGTGLGLSTVQGSVKAMGGEIKLKTTQGKGTRFDIYLPAQIEPVVAEEKKKKINQSYSGDEKILVVDDDPQMLESQKAVLKSFGYQVDIRNDSVEAAQLIESDPHAFDLVLSDLTMPKMKGDELASKVISLNPEMPVILCTGYNYLNSDQELKDLESKGIMAILEKPVSVKLLAKSIREILDGIKKES